MRNKDALKKQALSNKTNKVQKKKKNPLRILKKQGLWHVSFMLSISVLEIHGLNFDVTVKEWNQVSL